MIKNKKSDSTQMLSAEFSWIKNIIGFVKTFAFIGLLIAYIYYLENPDPNTSSIVLYTFIGVFAFIMILDIYQLSQLAKSSYAPYLIFLIASGITFGVFYLVGFLNNWNWFPSITGGMIVLYAIISLGFGKLSADISLKAVGDRSRRGGEKETFKDVLKRNRYYFSFILSAIGIMLITSGFLVEIAWYYQYLISALLFVPLAYFLIKDIQYKPLQEEEQNFMKRTEITQYIIEFIIMVSIFLLSLFVIWDLMPIGFQEIGYDNWIIFSAFLSILIVMIVHTLLEKDLLRGLSRKGTQRSSISSETRRSNPIETTMDSMEDLTMKEQLILIEAILIVIFSFSGYYYSSALRSILLLEENIFINFLVIISSFAFFFITLACIQYYYAVYISRTNKIELKSVRRIFYLIGIVYFILLTLGSIITAFTNLVDFFQISGIMIIVVMFVMWLDIIIVPRNDEVLKTADQNNISKKDYIFLIIGAVLLTISILLFVYIELSLTYLILNLFLLGFGILLIVNFIVKIIRNRKIEKPVKSEKDQSSKSNIIAIIILSVLLGLGIYIAIIYNPIDELVNFIIGIAIIITSIVLILSILIPYIKERKAIEKEMDNGVIIDFSFMIMLIISLILIVFIKQNEIIVNLAFILILITSLAISYKWLKVGIYRFLTYYLISAIIIVLAFLYIYLETNFGLLYIGIGFIVYGIVIILLAFYHRKTDIGVPIDKSDGKSRVKTTKVIVKRMDEQKIIKNKKRNSTEYIFK